MKSSLSWESFIDLYLAATSSSIRLEWHSPITYKQATVNFFFFFISNKKVLLKNDSSVCIKYEHKRIKNLQRNLVNIVNSHISKRNPTVKWIDKIYM